MNQSPESATKQHSTPDPTSEDAVFDVVVVGAGAAGMAAALTAESQGLKAVVIEKAPHFGGSTARSGGGLWIPNNHVLARSGVADTPEKAATYLAHIVANNGGGFDDGKAGQETFLKYGPPMLELIEASTPMRFKWVRGYSDYYPEAPGGMPGGRSIEPVPLRADTLGPLRPTLNPPYLASKGGLAITQADYRWLNLIARHPRGIVTATKVGIRAFVSRIRRRELLTMGQALAAGLRAGLASKNIPVWLSTPLVDVVVEDGRVIGVRVERDGQEVTVRASRGVILTAGGFERNAEMRQKYQRGPIGDAWTVGAAENTGDAIQIGERLGAGLKLMDDAWWGPSVPLPRGPYFLLSERTLPGSIMVNAAGHRFVNEAAPYVDAVHAMYDAHTDEDPHVPAWLVFDQRYRDRYLFATRSPRQPFPSKWYRAGVVAKADTVEKLAAEIGVPGDALGSTIERFNEQARTGVDEDFHRGESAYDKYYSDPRNRPNPSLAPLLKAPFYAVRIVPGDLGTKGGLTVDIKSRVIRTDGSVIPGLYAAGNTAATVMGHTYAGPGATLGPAMTSGYVAALDLAGTL
jgi:3-oxosteroid 1-dehydrogenase